MTQIQYLHIAFEVWGAIFCSLAAVIVYLTRHLDKRQADLLVLMLLTEAVLDVTETLSYYYRGDPSEIAFYMVRINNFIVFISGYSLALLAFLYFEHLIEIRSGEISPTSKSLIKISFAGGIILLIFSRIFNFYYDFDFYNRYYRLTGSYWIMPAIGMLMLTIIFIETVKNRRKFETMELIAFLTMSGAPLISLFVQTLHYGISITNLVNTIMIFFLFTVHQMKYSTEMRAKELELLEGRLRMYQMQMKPHFIFNSLSLIRSLMKKSEARTALDEFSRFLRGSLDMLSENKLVSVADEIKIIKNYLRLQKRRFEGKLTVEMEISDENFKIPGFTIQTLVENAIIHGIRNKSDGVGTLKIKIYVTSAAHVIEVSDDGVGFDIEKVKAESKTRQKSIGLKNLVERLKIMSSGTLKIESEPGKGTLARVLIPK